MSNFCGNSDITKIFVIEAGVAATSGTSLVLSGNLVVGGDIINCGSGSTIQTENIIACESGVTINNAITIYPEEVLPTSDNLISVGSPSRRFRSINTVSGTSTVWYSTTIFTNNIVYTPNLNLGADLSGDTRNITADNSIIQNDLLFGGDY